MERKLIAELFRYDMQEARAASEPAAEVARVESESSHYFTMYSEEEECIRSDAVIADARELDIAIPPRPSAYDDNEDWKSGQHFYSHALNQKGRARLREAIRKEQRDRHEGTAQWRAWLTLIGVFVGILVTYFTRR
jgi:hypothetical protein